MRQLVNAINEKNKLLETQFKQDWEQTRTLSTLVINTAQIDKAGKRKMLRNLKFPWDKEESFDKDKKQKLKELSDKKHGRTF